MKMSVKKKLARIAKQLAKLKTDYLSKGKAKESEIKKENIVWHLLLQSFSTMGKSSGWHGMIGNKENYNELIYDKIKSMKAKERLPHLDRICRAAKVRMPQQKAGYILGCFNKIEEEGGLIAVREKLLNKGGREEKVKYLKSFPGIGDKYARNMMMDVYHKDFRDSIAIDSRIKKISNSWNLEFKNYAEHEQFYLEVAEQAGLNGWELDRLMYKYSIIFENE